MLADITGVLLAGGKSRRMGEDKRYLQVGRQTLFERSLSVFRSVFQEVVVVIAQDSATIEAGVPVIRDLVPDCGGLGGLYTGLKQAATRHVFVAACDMPFLNPQAIRYVTALKDNADIVMVQRNTGLQPMHALYGRRCLPVIEEMVHTHNMKIQDIVAHPSLHVRLITEAELSQIDPEGRSFLNVNTPSDLEAARTLHARSTVPPSS
jgi:molybdopterin-guanine dinucleotide biosynthesis protein A